VVLVERGRDADEHGVRLAQSREVGGRLSALCQFAHRLAGNVPYHLLAVVDLRYAPRIGIEAEHGKAGAREAD